MQEYNGWIRYTKLKNNDSPTIGSQILSKVSAKKDNTHCAQDQVDEELKDYPNQVLECLENGKKHFDSDFYIHVLFCLDRILDGAKKNIFAAQRSCPIPFYDQAVYKYHKKDEKLELLWIVPDIDLCKLYRYNVNLVPDDEKDLYKNIIDFYSGELAKREYFENNKILKKIYPVTRS